LGTNPYDEDTDADGIGDYQEITLYKADPLKADTDADGMSDYDEIVVYHTNPSVSDTDSDGLSDVDEALVYKANPRLPDSDSDGIADRAEIARGTNPMSADTDADDVADGADECPLTAGKMEFRGCPAPPPAPVKGDTITITRIDTVRTFHRDTVFVTRTESVLPKEVVTIRKGQSFTVYGINFKSGSAVIEPESYPILDTVVLWLRQNAGISAEVRGHTDSIGKATANMGLSNDRAESVIAYLVKAGIAAQRLTPAGYGESTPVGDNSTPEGRALNRRIEFYVKNK
jgi:outer membrane protein OmpA-like peptidoglycan-associated protein